MLAQQTLTVERFAAGSYVDGVWTEGAKTTTTITGTLQPYSERGRQQMLRVPEGWRASVLFSLYTRDTSLQALTVQGGRTADRLVWEGKRLWIASLHDYSAATTTPGMALAHRQYLLLREEFTP